MHNLGNQVSNLQEIQETPLNHKVGVTGWPLLLVLGEKKPN